MRNTKFKQHFGIYCCSILTIFILNLISLGQCLSPPAGLTGWWTGDGNSFDNRGINHAAFVNGPAYSAGKVNQAFSFNGTNQYLTIPQIANLPVRGTSSFTIEGWVNQQGSGVNAAFNVFAYRSGGDDVQFIVTPTEVVIWGTWAAGDFLRIAHGVDPAVWNHYAFTRSGNVWRVYVNGAQIGSDITSNVDLLTPTTTQNVGTTGAADTQFALGMIDELSIYNRALSASEIQTIATAGVNGKCHQCTPAPVGLVSWWAAENNAIDARSGNSGIFEGTAAYATGKTGLAFDFNGSDNDVKVPATSSLNVGAGTGITIDGWINPSTLAQNSPLFEWNNGLSYGTHLWMYRLNGADGNLFFNLVDTGGGNHYNQTTGPVLTANQWQHIALTYDKASGIIAVYVNGAPVPLASANLGSFTPQTSYDFYLGDRPPGFPDSSRFSGGMDEIELFNRALTPSEIAMLALAGAAGKCKPTAVTAPSGLTGWWAGDGDAMDTSGQGHNGILENGVDFVVGKSGQGFTFDGNAGRIGFSNAFPPLTAATIEGWLNPTVLTGGYTDSTFPGMTRRTAAGFNGNCADLSIGLYGGKLGGIFRNPGGCAGVLQSGFNAQAGVWYHVAMTDDGSNVRLYVNGSLEATAPADPNYTIYNNFRIGGAYCCNGDNFGGKVDEVSLYNRALSITEIQSIYNAGIAGKLKSATTPLLFSKFSRALKKPTFEGVSTAVGDAQVQFFGVTIAGETQEIPLPISQLPPIPSGYAQTGLVYDVSTSAVYTFPPTVCFNLAALVPQFASLRILHLENGNWIDQTNLFSSSPNLCTNSLNSLSPFAIVRLAPTAAPVNVGGRIVNGAGGIRGVRVVLTDPTGTRRTALTNSFGNYRFDGVTSGATYVIEVFSKKYRFDNPTRVVYVGDELLDVDFSALE